MYWFVFCKEDIILTSDHRIPTGDDCPVALEPWNTVHRLPELGGVECRCVAVDRPVEPGSTLCQMSLRASYDVLPAGEYQMAGKAREIIYWDFNTRYCGVCGSPMEKDSDISKRCTSCGKQVWPALATAIIVLVRRRVCDEAGATDAPSATYHDEALMVRAHNFRGDHYGLVAGFVETGESLEECLEREVMEETGIRVKNIRYFGSQPWPYPSGLMVGYFADYDGGEISLQKSELAAGGWFRRDNLPTIPGRVSLARRLIDKWLEADDV